MIKIITLLIYIVSINLLWINKASAVGTLVHQYTFDDAWGSSSPVIDTKGSRNGTVVGVVNRITNASFGGGINTCAAADFGQGYISLNNLNLNTNFLAQTSVSFWMRWDGTQNQMPFSWDRHDLWLNDNKFGFNSWVNNIYGISSLGLVNPTEQWVHVVAVFNNDDMGSNKLYINSELQNPLQSTSDISNGNAFVKIAMAIGANSQNYPTYRFTGHIGNFRIYQGEVSPTQVAADMNDVSAACGSVASLSLERIITDYNANVCAVDGHVLKVLDSNGQLITNFNQTVTLSSNDNEGTWSVRQGDGVLTMPVNNNGAATYKFASSDNGQVTLDFVHNSIGSVTLGAEFNGVLATSNTVFGLNNSTEPWMLEAGDIALTSSNSRSNFQSVTFKHTTPNLYSYPPIVLVNPTNQEFEPVLVKVRNVTRTGFEVSAVSYRNNQSINAMSLKYVAIEPGIHEFEDGTKVEACVVPLSTVHRGGEGFSSTTQVNFKQAFTQAPAVVNKLQSLNNTNDRNNHRFINPWLTEAARNLSASGIRLTLERAEVYGGLSPILTPSQINGDALKSPEINGYVAIERSTVNFADNNNNNIAFESLLTDSVVRGRGNNAGNIDRFTQLSPYSIPPTWVGSKVSASGTDGGWLVRHNIASQGVFMSIDEDKFRNNERSHIPENIGVFVFDKTFKATIFEIPPVDHYRFKIIPTGLTCVPSNIELKACENASCTNTVSTNSTLTLSSSPSTGLWSGIDVTSNNVDFTNSTFLKLTQPNNVLTGISAINLSPVPVSSTPIQCFNGSVSVSCSILFKDTGFIFSNIPHQISNKSSLVDFNGQVLTIQAVKKNENTKACEAIFPDGSDRNIELKLNCISGACNSDIAITTDSSAVAASVNTSFSNVAFNFNSDSIANYELNYPNAGEFSLSAKFVSGTTKILEGVSNNFVVKPFGFYVTIGDPNAHATTASGTVFKNAGETFEVKATAIRWMAVGEDTDNDGQIDASANAGDNDPVVSFATGENVQLNHQLQLPVGGVDGSFSATPKQLAASEVTFNDAKWNEVGIISLTAQLEDNDYLGAGDVIGVIANVGRFRPDHFTMTLADTGDLTSQCELNTFIGETTADGDDVGSAADGALYFSVTNPSMTLSAMDAGGSYVTKNYQGNFKRWKATDSVTFSPLTSSNGLAVTGVINEGVFADVSPGVFTYTMSEDDNFVYTRNTASKVAPFSAGINFPIDEIKDEDGVTTKSGVSLPDLTALSIAGHKMRYGRVYLTNAFGPEDEMLAMPIEHQYFDGGGFVKNTSINASTNCDYAITPNTDFTLSPVSLGSLNQAALIHPVTWSNGAANLLIAPSGEDGTVEFLLNTPPWLLFDWDNSGTTADTPPKANATFGRYRGNDRIINWRERR